ncbi:hypothetical protein DNTS_010169 [Danionella cerebrum]|uniref:Cyclin-like domain-containing protein n=1 Tax=Danionella cerebrum TaxID=2873325 RepID=A0A553Q6N6_9TELE|nr:hypothetical protein DNTS_010169 [Danionella translucida]
MYLFIFFNLQGSNISPSQFHDVIVWLLKISNASQFSSETFTLGVCVINSMLAAVRTQLKYLKCMAITSLILAAKINEEDEATSSVKDVLELSGCRFSMAEIQRMERVILRKLHWELHVRCIRENKCFCHFWLNHLSLALSLPVQFHALLASGPSSVVPQSMPILQGALWSKQLQQLMACSQLWPFRGSRLALAIITRGLESGHSAVAHLLTRAQIEPRELLCCQEVVDKHLNSPKPQNSIYIHSERLFTLPERQEYAHLEQRGTCQTEEEEESTGLPCPPLPRRSVSQ